MLHSKKGSANVSEEEGEVKEDDSHPLATVSNINPEEIPEIPVNKFLLRGGASADRRGKKKLIYNI